MAKGLQKQKAIIAPYKKISSVAFKQSLDTSKQSLTLAYLPEIQRVQLQCQHDLSDLIASIHCQKIYYRTTNNNLNSNHRIPIIFGSNISD